LIVRDAFVLALVGVTIGVGGAIAAGRWVQAFLYGVSAFDTATLASVAAGSLALAIAVASVPALRAAAIDPIEALKE
jgi:ABC-type antimicrobial peptide transport system permease subunit